MLRLLNREGDEVIRVTKSGWVSTDLSTGREVLLPNALLKLAQLDIEKGPDAHHWDRRTQGQYAELRLLDHPAAKLLRRGKG